MSGWVCAGWFCLCKHHSGHDVGAIVSSGIKIANECEKIQRLSDDDEIIEKIQRLSDDDQIIYKSKLVSGEIWQSRRIPE